MLENEIELLNLSLRYPSSDEFSLKNINFKIKKGDVIAVVGESGCGKTSLLRAINGLASSYYKAEIEGKVFYKGKDITESEIGNIARNIGTVFQNPKSQFFNLDTSTELVFGPENIGMSEDEIWENIENVVNSLNLKNLVNRNIFMLSGGERQKIAIGEVLAMGIDVFLLDEVSSNLDVKEIVNLREILKKLKRVKKTIIINEHRLYWLNELVDKYVFIKDGVIENIFPKKDFLKFSQEKLYDLGLRNTIMELENSYDCKKEFKNLYLVNTTNLFIRP